MLRRAGRATIAIYSFGGDEILKVDVSVDVSSWELRTLVADKLHLKVHNFDLVDRSGTIVSEAWKVAEQVSTTGKPIVLTLMKDDVTRKTPSGYLNLQSIDSQSVAAHRVGAKHKKNYTNPFWFVSFSVLAIVLFLPSVSQFCEQAVKLFLLAASNGNRDWLTADLSSQVWWMQLALLSSMYLIESLLSIDFTFDEVPCWNSTVLDLQNMNPPESVIAYVERMKRATPVMMIRIHHSREIKVQTQEFWYDESEEPVKRETCQKELIHDDNTLDVEDWCDESGEFLSVLQRFPLVHIHFGVACRAADETTAQHHLVQIESFRVKGPTEEYCYLDAEEGDYDQPLPLMEMLACGYSVPCWLDWRFYVFASCIGFSWLYRWWLTHMLMHGDFIFIKRVWSHRSVDA